MASRPRINRLASSARFGHRPGMLAAFRDRRGSTQLLALAIVAGAVLMRLLVPQGWMPAHTAAGWRITICSGVGPLHVAMPGMAAADAHHPSGDRDHGSGDRPCAFAVLALAIAEARPPMPTISEPRIAPVVRPAAAAVAIGRWLAAPPPPATGPPALL